MQDFEEQERRLMAALGRLGSAMERLTEAPTAAQTEAADTLDSAAEVEIARLSQLLESARADKAALEARVEQAGARQAETLVTLQERSAGLAAQVEAQSADLQKLRQVNIQLREALRGLRGALSAGVADAQLINEALLAEVEEMRAARQVETNEIDALLRAVEPLVAPAAETKEADNAGA